MGSGRETEEEICEDRINRLIESRKMLFNAPQLPDEAEDAGGPNSPRTSTGPKFHGEVPAEPEPLTLETLFDIYRVGIAPPKPGGRGGTQCPRQDSNLGPTA